MQEWTPISLQELNNEIVSAEKDFTDELKNFWDLIKIDPVKWQEKEYGEMGGGFWVVAVFGSQIIWYNDIEEGFNVSDYNITGKIEDYCCNQDQLLLVITKLFNFIKSGQETFDRRGGAQSMMLD